MTSHPHIGVPIQWNGGHLGVPWSSPVGFETFSYVKLFQFCFSKLAQLLSALNFGKVVFLAVQEQLYSSFQRSRVAPSKCLVRTLQAYFLTFHSPAPHNTLCLPTPPLLKKIINGFKLLFPNAPGSTAYFQEHSKVQSNLDITNLHLTKSSDERLSLPQ